MPLACKLTFHLQSDRVMCDVGYLCADFSLPRCLCSQLRPDVRDRQTTDVRRQTDVRRASSPYAPAYWGWGIILSLQRRTVLIVNQENGYDVRLALQSVQYFPTDEIINAVGISDTQRCYNHGYSSLSTGHHGVSRQNSTTSSLACAFEKMSERCCCQLLCWPLACFYAFYALHRL